MLRSALTMLVLFLVCTAGLPTAVASAGGPKTLKLGQLELHRNGSGVRKKGLLSLYEASLYLTASQSHARTIIEADQPMAIRIQIISGFVSQSNLLEALNEGFQKATGGDTRAIAAQIQNLQDCLSDPINKNDVVVLSYIPGSGVLVHRNGEQKGIIPGLEFKQALFAIWLSDQPADAGLRTALLGSK